jgi:hypothetical protein
MSHLALRLPVAAFALLASAAPAATALTIDSGHGGGRQGVHHHADQIFAAARSGTALVQPGTQTGFDDLWSGDFNYFALRFAFLNAASKVSIDAVPEPANWAMLIAGFGCTGAMLRRSRLRSVA